MAALRALPGLPGLPGLRALLALLALLAAAAVLPVDANHDAKRLYDDLLRKSGYNKLIRPVANSSASLVIELGLKVSQVMSVDEKNEIITMNMWMTHEWLDENLMWDPREYGNVRTLYVPSESIWLPDIVLYNNADGDYTVTIMTKATISWYGRVQWEPPVIFKSQCDIDVEYFPFDQQECFLKFGVWTYTGWQVDLKHVWHKKYQLKDPLAVIDPGMDLRDYYPNVEWDVMEVRAQKHIAFYPCCIEPYPDVTFNITIRRKTLFYTINLIIPCVALCMLTVLGFYMPSECGEKISLTITILLSLSMFQMLLMEIIPPTSLTVPIVGKYILFTTVIVSMSIFKNVAILNLNFRSSATHDLPAWARRLFLEFLPPYLWLKRPEKQEENDFADFDEPQSDLSNYENPYRKTLRPIYGGKSTDDLFSHISTSFIGFDPNSVDCSSFCQACTNRRMKGYPVNMRKGYDGLMFITRHLRDTGDELKDDWQFLGLIVDRILLWIYTAVCVLGALIILMNAPALYDATPPLPANFINS